VKEKDTGIAFYDSHNKGYNLTEGGDGRGSAKGRKQTTISNEKRSKTMKKLYGDNHPLKGLKLSVDHKEKIKTSLRGLKHSPDRRRNQSISGKNRIKGNCIHCNKLTGHI
jgi:hypothetical protein